MQSDGAGFYATAALGQRHEDNQLILKSSETTLQEKERERRRSKGEKTVRQEQCSACRYSSTQPPHCTFRISIVAASSPTFSDGFPSLRSVLASKADHKMILCYHGERVSHGYYRALLKRSLREYIPWRCEQECYDVSVVRGEIRVRRLFQLHLHLHANAIMEKKKKKPIQR